MGMNKELHRQISEYIANDPSTRYEMLEVYKINCDKRPYIKGVGG